MTSLHIRIVGYDNTDEILAIIMWMFIGVVFYSYTIGLISTYFAENDTKSSLLKRKQRNLYEFCSELKIDDDLHNSLDRALEFSATRLTYQWLEPHKRIFEELPPRLKFEFLSAIYGEFINQCPFFDIQDIGFVVRIVPLLKPLACKAGTILYKTGDFSGQGRVVIIQYTSSTKER